MASFVGRNKAYRNTEIKQLLEEWMVADQANFKREITKLILDHGNGLPIFSAHYIKTAQAVFEEVKHLAPGEQQVLLAALNRFVHSPIKQKHARRLVHQGINLVKRDFE